MPETTLCWQHHLVDSAVTTGCVTASLTPLFSVSCPQGCLLRLTILSHCWPSIQVGSKCHLQLNCLFMLEESRVCLCSTWECSVIASWFEITCKMSYRKLCKQEYYGYSKRSLQFQFCTISNEYPASYESPHLPKDRRIRVDNCIHLWAINNFLWLAGSVHT